MIVSFAQFLGVHVEEISKTRTCQSSYCSKFDGNVCVCASISVDFFLSSGRVFDVPVCV